MTHCHICLDKLLDKDVVFYMADCSHIVCSPCRQHGLDKCPLCKKTCQFVAIGDQIPEKLGRFLKSPKALLEDAEKVIQFQISTLYSFAQSLKEKNKKQKQLLDKVHSELLAAKEYKLNEYSQRELPNSPSTSDYSSYRHCSSPLNKPNDQHFDDVNYRSPIRHSITGTDTYMQNNMQLSGLCIPSINSITMWSSPPGSSYPSTSAYPGNTVFPSTSYLIHDGLVRVAGTSSLQPWSSTSFHQANYPFRPPQPYSGQSHWR
ncbi:hypothetical protein PHYBLDRAFT_150604 [Phycomyces blakesleeanus NRRL 1555(-)]|uniref:RING-type domain-containing protein n=1 Tax=Phycomyces blakesleeanus (strain ATCC 8743b / DSM 1359 / FGSC 10004 / NBRC 33097 / NRRL 1555) TaxID=763407 RepID=A0A167KMD1_PHYB8|nr:hypothetical protein PHYBLDRAFT_150604 [Phycomyces blakesleeanus NRRL 1555(-)]OAD68425.1 hypothetical protein PHYBLDRAFT_150604 [Phycomyces blakesleeanus NRRL 1555(-)]|eukprot:XP_018286465.1 hypothetical protein PHYBLDRAFT_150604 [Phycomyces blakesleeanus NRRL 1555(-)]